jgi:hypothetical protein
MAEVAMGLSMSEKSNQPPQPFAYDANGLLVHVNDVPRGLACQCRCVVCDGRLVARHGQIRKHGFAHYQDTECSGGTEAAIHLAAKELLVRERRLFLPGLQAYGAYTDERGSRFGAWQKLPDVCVTLDDVQVEQRIGNIVPDLSAKVGKRELLIEIAVTHFADEQKIAYLSENRRPAVEIDLSDVNVCLDGWDVLHRRLIDTPKYKKWLFNPRMSELEHAAYAQAKANAEKDFKKRLNITGFVEELHALQLFHESGDASTLREQHALNGPTHKMWGMVDRILRVRYDSPPHFINVVCDNDLGIMADARVWQGAIFVTFVMHPAYETFSIRPVVRWVLDNIGGYDKFSLLKRHASFLTNEEIRRLPSATLAVRNYLRMLIELGVLSEEPNSRGRRWRVLRRNLRELLRAHGN